ncbi:adenylyl-sulfate kinase [Halarcobacter sp.]|uniref:adenylyl-sulfate kinase n=1 Tax=Halarcobacter sp. TaxID=2321133 RepID=UPI002AA81E46|nr:adenylyl-sulfate kinase [Halarcobacter sp.]
MNNIFLHENSINKESRIKLLNQKPYIIWLTGLSASGKSTLANALEVELYKKGFKTYLLDGDNLRDGLNNDLGFSKKDREENIRRVAHLSQILLDAGLIVITAFISPYKKDRKYARSLVKEDEFIEVFVDTPLEICEKRDPKGLYKKARAGKIKDFTGIDSAYEKPDNAEIIIKNENIEKSLYKIINFLEK